MIEVKIPQVGESVTEVTLSEWLVKDGDIVKIDQVIATIDSEKASFEINAEKSGQISIIVSPEETIEIGTVIAKIDENVEIPEDNTPLEPEQEKIISKKLVPDIDDTQKTDTSVPNSITPLAAKMANNHDIDINAIPNSGGRKINKNDVLNQINEAKSSQNQAQGEGNYVREKKETKLTALRLTIARRLTEAKNTTAMLTTFNEVDMSVIMSLRKKYKEKFKETHDVNLGFMSFFTKATAYALQAFPKVNSYIEGNKMITHNYCDISIAVSTPKGLVVPVIRDAQRLSMADIERAVVNLATKARDGKLSIEEMTGGTFTITNGGVFGSLLSTPIINIPQSAILGMHTIQERPVAINGKVEVRPMMYLALSYDHRIIDGKESVGFLVHIKELLQNPENLFTGKAPALNLLNI